MKIYMQSVAKLKCAIWSVFTILLAFSTSLVSADNYQSSDNWEKMGYCVISQDNSSVLINYSIGEFVLVDQEIKGETFQNISLPGHFLPNDAGVPNLPGSGRYIAVPRGAEANLKIVSFLTDTLNNINIAPSFRIPLDTENGPLDYSKNETIYSANKLFPEEPFVLSVKEKIRGIDVTMLGITPFQYNPVSKQLIVYRDIKIEISFKGGTGSYVESRLRSRWWDPMLSDMLLNYESLSKMDYNKSYQSTDETGCEYLVITPNDTEFQYWADSIKKFRTTQGIYTNVVTLSEIGGNTAEDIENYIDNAYNNWDVVPAACLLLGDYGTDASNRITSPLWNNYCVSDNVYADVDDNNLPDIIFARITAQEELQLEVMVTKFLEYERTPPVEPDFYSHPITSLGWQTDSWFQICSEVIGGFWREELEKDPVRVNEIYSGTPGTEWSTAINTQTVTDYFGPNGLGYIPEQPDELGGWSGGSADMINNAIDNGAFMVQHRDHGYEEGWGQPEYSSISINSLTNTDLTFVWSINSLTGKYNYGSEVFAEKFHRYTYKDENSGCFGINAASEVTYAFVSDVYVWGAYDNMWPDFMPNYGTSPESAGVLPAFASAAGKYFLEQSNWPSNTENKEATYHLFHHHGDAFTTVYTEVPQSLTVSHESFLYMGETTFEVTANIDALIALSVDGELIGTGIGTGTPISINIPVQAPPSQVLITVTKQNYFRYESSAEVLPASGPYVVYNDIAINDESGNGNGIMETSELILASITVKNVGVEDAENVIVSLSTTDTYVTITDGSENYGTLTAGSTSIVANGFSWDVADNIPDLHVVNFEVTISDGTSSWSSFFNITGHAPLIEFGNMLIEDYQGNLNGRLDPGETAFLIIPTQNNGSYVATNTLGTLSCTNEFITINDGTYNFYDIGAGLTEEAILGISVSENAIAGTYIEFIYEVTTGGYTEQHIYTSIISPVVEDWETGDLSQFEWSTGGEADWTISSQNPYEGSFCIKSGIIDHNQSSFLSIPVETFVNDSVSFWCRVSSETGYDSLTFYIDDIEQASWSGELEWNQSSYLLSAGTHTLKWEYKKDESYSSGDDCGWIDFVVFPVNSIEASFSSDFTNVCENESVNFYDESPGTAISWDWIFEGGTPETSNLQNPEIEYLNSGMYDVSLTVSDGIASNTLVLEDYITVSSLPETAPTPTGPENVCGSTENTTYNTVGIAGISEYDWVLEPSEAGDVTGTGLEATITWTEGFLGDVTLSVAGTNDCGTGAYSSPLNITRYLPEVSLQPFELVCINTPEFELTGGLPTGGTYSGSGVDDGWFYPEIAGLGTHTITYTYADANSCENFAEETIFVDPCPGINNKTNVSQVNIYPNPTSGIINISFDQDIGKAEIIVINTLNKVVYSETTKTTQQKYLKIDLSNQSKGIYTIILKTQKKEERLKVILK